MIQCSGYGTVLEKLWKVKAYFYKEGYFSFSYIITHAYLLGSFLNNVFFLAFAFSEQCMLLISVNFFIVSYVNTAMFKMFFIFSIACHTHSTLIPNFVQYKNIPFHLYMILTSAASPFIPFCTLYLACEELQEKYACY